MGIWAKIGVVSKLTASTSPCRLAKLGRVKALGMIGIDDKGRIMNMEIMICGAVGMLRIS